MVKLPEDQVFLPVSCCPGQLNPGATIRHSWKRPAQHPQNQLNLFYAKLHQVLDQQYQNAQAGQLENLPPVLQLSQPALKVWLDYLNSVEAALGAGGDMEYYKDIASKSADNASRLGWLVPPVQGG
ncbi:MAG: DUF3987 domain-containing protein [Thiolinea sp.]